MQRLLSVNGWWLSIASVVFLFSAHWMYGANTNALAVFFSLLAFLLCLIALVAASNVQWIFAAPGLKSLALLFGLLLIFVGLQLTPYLPGGAHPFWAWADARGSLTLDRDATIRELAKLGALGAVFVTGLIIGADDRRATLFFKTMIGIGVLFALWAFVTYISTANQAPNGYARRFIRLHANFQSANNAAVLLGMLGLISLAAIIRVAKKVASASSGLFQFLEHFVSRSPVSLIGLLLSLILLMLTASRGGILASTFAVFVFIGWELSRSQGRAGGGKNAIGAFILVSGLLSLAVIVSGDLVVERFTTARLGDANRLETFTAHWRAISAALWTGYGMGTFYLVNDTLMNVQNWVFVNNIGAMHNVYLQWLEEGGLIGAFFMWSLLGGIIWSIFMGLRRRRRMRTWIRSVLCITLLLLLHGFVDYSLQVPSISMSWAMLLGVGFGLGTVRPIEA